MKTLSNKHLKEALFHAKKLELDPEFIRLLEQEHNERFQRSESIQKESGESVM